MRFLFTHRFFWPDTAPYAVILRSIAETFAGDGHEVHVLSSRPSYRNAAHAAVDEMPAGIYVRRCPAFRERGANPLVRSVNALIYCVGLFLHVRRLRPDVVTASTFPPVLAAWTASLAAWSVDARFVYHMQDIHPEVSRLSGGMLGRGIFGWLMTRLDNQTLRRSNAIVVLSEDMAGTLRARRLGTLPIEVINNFALDEFEAVRDEPPAELLKSAGTRRVIFAGNLGRFQDLPRLTEGIALCLARHPDLELMFLGDGVALSELTARWGGHPQIVFGPFLPYPQARALIGEADIGVLSLRQGIHRVAYPSKMLTYLALGLPVLALVEPDSSLAQLVREERLGSVPEARDPKAIACALESLLECPVPREHVATWHDANAGRRQVLECWKLVLGAPVC